MLRSSRWRLLIGDIEWSPAMQDWEILRFYNLVRPDMIVAVVTDGMFLRPDNKHIILLIISPVQSPTHHHVGWFTRKISPGDVRLLDYHIIILTNIIILRPGCVQCTSLFTVEPAVNSKYQICFNLSRVTIVSWL